MTDHRRAAAAALLALLLATAGCLGVLTGQSRLQATASAPSVDAAVLDTAGNERARTATRQENQTFTVAGQSRTANVTSRLAEYQKTVDLGPAGEYRAAVFAVLATPQVNVLGQTRNPVGGMSSVELVHTFQSQYEGLTVGQTVGTTNATMLGEETEVTKLAGSASVGPVDVDVFVYVTRVRHEGDYVLAFAVYPQLLSDEEAIVLTLLGGVGH